jgi:hypothetical protein
VQADGSGGGGEHRKEFPVAKNHPTGNPRRVGAVRQRSQTKMPDGRWVKRDDTTGRFMDIKSDNKPFKGVRKEK